MIPRKIAGAAVIAACTFALCAGVCSCSGGSPAGLSPEENVAQAKDWANSLERDALAALADEGVIAPAADNAALFEDVFEFENRDQIVYQDAQAGQALEGYFALDGKVIICSNTGEAGNAPHVAYLDSLAEEDEAGNALPLFRPNQYGKAESTLIYLGDSYEILMDGVDYDAFANSLAKCDYLIAYDAIDTEVRENYYVGGADRVTVTTIAVIFDVRNRKVAHIEVIGSDTPNGSKEGPRGKLLDEDLARYLNTLLKR